MELEAACEALYGAWKNDGEANVTAEATWALWRISDVEKKDDEEKWEVIEKKVEAWWAKKKSSMKSQLRAVKPAIRQKLKDKPKDEDKK
jgi:hypothetical protein